MGDWSAARSAERRRAGAGGRSTRSVPWSAPPWAGAWSGAWSPHCHPRMRSTRKSPAARLPPKFAPSWDPCGCLTCSCCTTSAFCSAHSSPIGPARASACLGRECGLASSHRTTPLPLRWRAQGQRHASASSARRRKILQDDSYYLSIANGNANLTVRGAALAPMIQLQLLSSRRDSRAQQRNCTECQRRFTRHAYAGGSNGWKASRSTTVDVLFPHQVT